MTLRRGFGRGAAAAITRMRTTLMAFLAIVAALGGGQVAAAKEIELSGVNRSDTLVVASGDSARATGDVYLVCSKEIVIDGTLTGAPGCVLVLKASKITVRGSIAGGPGVNQTRVGAAGGAGGSVMLIAETISITTGSVRAGNGGNAGPAGDGGDGGDVIFSRKGSMTGGGALIGGNAGRAGIGVNGFGNQFRNGGNGGDGGSVRPVTAQELARIEAVIAAAIVDGDHDAAMPADLTADGVVDEADLEVLLGSWRG